MDAHVFRRITAELAPLITGARLHKIYSLAPKTLLFIFTPKNDAASRKLHLIFQHGRDRPALFPLSEKPQAPERPSAEAMRLRKYFQGKHVRHVYDRWDRRTLTLDFSSPAGGGPLFLVLNLAPDHGHPAVILQHGPGPDVDAAPAWPAPADLPEILNNDAVWRNFPVLTPLLRKTLALLSPPDQAALLADLRAGNGDIFMYEKAREVAPTGCGQPRSGASENHAFRAARPECRTGGAAEGYMITDRELSAWPLPESLRRGRVERVFPFGPSAALAAAECCYAQQAMDSINLTARAALHHEMARARKSNARLAVRLDEEERKLHAWCAKKEEALLLQAHLHAFAKDFKAAAVTLDGPDGPVRIELDPLLGLSENMSRFFHLAAKGRRGLAHLARRREELASRVREFESNLHGLGADFAPAGERRLAAAPPPRAAKNKGGSPGAPREDTPSRYKDIACFKSSAGFMILRGRNAAGNQALLKVASGHDFWLHAKDGPSAHTVLRRAHALVEVPEESLLEAAALTALKSDWKNDSRAEITLALVRDVRPFKGGAPGQVLVDKVLRTLIVRPDPDLEIRLSV